MQPSLNELGSSKGIQFLMRNKSPIDFVRRRHMFFLQMSGFPGSGKSTLARMVAQSTAAIVIDHDIVKTAMLDSLNNEMDPKRVGAIAYSIEWALVDFHLSQGHSVILDSPCLYDELVDRGTTLAAKHAAQYKYVECILDDINELNRRLTSRPRMPSQIGPVDIPSEHFQEVINRSKKPVNLNCIRVNTTQPIETYLVEVLAYINK